MVQMNSLPSASNWMIDLVTSTSIKELDPCMSKLVDELSKDLACHDPLNPKQSSESALALQDGHITFQQTLQHALKNPDFVYLSGHRDEENPDEPTHLAAAMQFAGFRSVIGTMCAVDDARANKVTSAFYKLASDKPDRLDHTRAAFALQRTMESVDIPLDRSILYIHLGA